MEGGSAPDEDESRREHPLAAEEWLASRVLECLADPRAVCRLALVNKNFSVASASDPVWQKLLPPAAILNPLLPHLLCHPPSKKHLFFALCKSITYDRGLQKFWLDQATGGECHMISAKALCIAWGDTQRYWEWKSYPGSMFSEVACLRAVCWLEVTKTIQYLFRPGRYMVSFRLQLHSKVGWRRMPVKLCVQNTTEEHPPHESQVLFNGLSFKVRSCPSNSGADVEETNETHGVQTSADKDWVECDVGEFFVDEDDDSNRPIEIKISMLGTDGYNEKRGLVLDGVIIRPSYVIDNSLYFQ